MNDIFDTYADAYREETEKIVTSAAPPVLQKKSDRFCVYIGPSILGLLSAQQVFRGIKEDALQQINEAVKKYPQCVPRLLVTDEELPQARLQVRQQGTLLYTTYQKFLQELRKGSVTNV